MTPARPVAQLCTLGMLVEATRPQPCTGLFSGKSKPGNVDIFMKDFVEEMGDLEGNGLMDDNKVGCCCVKCCM